MARVRSLEERPTVNKIPVLGSSPFFPMNTTCNTIIWWRKNRQIICNHPSPPPWGGAPRELRRLIFGLWKKWRLCVCQLFAALGGDKTSSPLGGFLRILPDPGTTPSLLFTNPRAQLTFSYPLLFRHYHLLYTPFGPREIVIQHCILGERWYHTPHEEIDNRCISSYSTALHSSSHFNITSSKESLGKAIYYFSRTTQGAGGGTF